MLVSRRSGMTGSGRNVAAPSAPFFVMSAVDAENQ